MRSIAPCALARITSAGVSSVSGACSSGNVCLRIDSAQAGKVITGTPSTSSDGSTRDTYDASARW